MKIAKKPLNPKLVSFSLVVVSVALSLLCALFIALVPQASLKFFGSIFHGIDMAKIAAPITVSGVLTGLIAVAIIAFVIGWLFAVIYNYLSSRVRE